MNRQAQAAVLFLVGAAVLHAGSTDLYLRYVKAGLQPLLLGAGVVLIVAAVATVWYEVRAGRSGRGMRWPRGARSAPEDGRPEAERDDVHGERGGSGEDDGHGDDLGDSHGDEHGHGHREPRISWLLVLPLLALILVAPPALGSYSAMRTGTALQAPFGYPALPAGDPLPLGLVDYAGRAAYDHGRSLGDRRIRITGFVALDRSGTPYLVRMALNCCAADAQPVKIGLSGRIPPVLQPDTWLEVTGTYTSKRTKDPVNGGIIPFLKVSQARPVPTPHDPYDESWNN
ncbi:MULTISPECIES: TIGR03943 family putative permease subunit [unclassified Streptomyces]|uniref:TIGR03943 family putative permease subunit n=1 Tax=unclassified Streptomyces TaxID=2593676 RepID=UPI002E803CC4|nr:TIGR03943 family protein [Streptomyces sp. NBC_00589]WTI41262.1 TIGR03943 family protein [Streptomyces sp. NBC_00775]WUB25054.1 TIGR03943 family protein [Streptomyces sp. NBC_00589]